ncbi:MAG: NUDIX hydrolase [Calothrix sp. FI2-JRJ7]|jgi:ADP-ribose pyrophosphatase YjhB (NUDIX family)|nr:NUDIX hydrolase [Calothrix sp. FI2-JRJ7]
MNIPTQAAIAILYRDNKFLMQLRDNIPTIRFPGYWALFGGHIEPGETPEVAVQREILEEIGYKLPSTFSFFGCYRDENVVRHVFSATLDVEFEQLALNEGWDMAMLLPSDICKGSYYSDNAKEKRLLAPVHQQILINFMDNNIHPS